MTFYRQQIYIFSIFKLLEAQECIFSTMATYTLVLKHQAISIHSVDKYSLFIVLDPILKEILHLSWTIDSKIIFLKEWNSCLTHSGIYAPVGLTIIGSDNGLLPNWHQAIIWTTVCLLSNGPFGISFSETQIKIQQFPFRKMCLKMMSAKWLLPFCLGLNMLKC